MNQFAEAFRAFLHRKQRLEEIRKTYERVERQRMSVETRIEQIKNLFKIRKRKKLNFSEMVQNDGSRFNVVITFMGLLEMLKDRRVDAEQKKRFGDITVSIREDVNE